MDAGVGFGMFILFGAITFVIGYLAVQQSKIKREIEESRRKREQDELIALGGIDPSLTGLPPGVPPTITPNPHAHPQTPDASGGHSHGHDAGGSGGHDAGGASDGSAGHH